MAVNGIEIKVGQVWRQGDGRHVYIVKSSGRGWETGATPERANTACVTPAGKDRHGGADYDLIELIRDEHGFTIWRGGEQPGETKGKTIQWRVNGSPLAQEDAADSLRWEHILNGKGNDLVAYKIVEETTEVDPDALAAETLESLGWRFDGQTWVQEPKAEPELQIEMFEPAVNAIGLLDKAAGHMRDRAATYDKPEGERSMAQTVGIFNLHHGTSLTEAQGWHFMQVLKNVRMFTRPGYHADSAEDSVAYGALMAEAKAKEGGAA